MNFTFGADVEFFLRDKTQYRSAFRVLKGTKEEPEILNCKAGLHWDNVAAEFASVVSSSEDEFFEAITAPIKEITEKVKPLKLVPASSANFPPGELTNMEECEFGCEPDFDAWELKMNQAPVPPNEELRSCGGHIHIGYVKGAPKELLDPYGKVAIVKLLDVFLGVPFVILDPAIERRKLYGRAGCHRPTGYGVEYRTLSNYWTRSEQTIRLVYKLAKETLKSLDRSEEIISAAGGKEKIVSCINEGNIGNAKEITSKVIVPSVEAETRECLLGTLKGKA